MDIGAAAKGNGFGASSFHRVVCVHLRNNSLTWNEAPNQFLFATDTDHWPTSACQRQRAETTNACKLWGNEGTAEGGGLGTSGLHPQCCQNPHKYPSSRTEVLAAFHLAGAAWSQHAGGSAAGGGDVGRVRGSYGCGSRIAIIRVCSQHAGNRRKKSGGRPRNFCTWLH